MKHCPYCFSGLDHKCSICPHCKQYLLDDMVELDYDLADKKRCLYCGKEILTEARVCKFCQRWVDELGSAGESD